MLINVVFIFGILIIIGCVTLSYFKSSKKYDGELLISVNDNGVKVYSLELDIDVSEIDLKDKVMFKVRKMEE